MTRERRIRVKTSTGIALAVCVAAVVACSAYIVVCTDLLDDGPDAVQDGDLIYSGSMVAAGITGTGANNTATITYAAGDSATQWYLLDMTDTAYVESNGVYTERGYELAGTGTTLTVTTPGYYYLRMVSGDTEVTGDIVLDGTVTRSYEWTQRVSGITYTYSFDFSYEVEAYLAYAWTETTRHQSSYLEDSRFAVVDDDISRLQTLLAAEYSSVRGATADTGQAYADYLLSFVQCCIDYPDRIAETSSGTYVLDKTNGSGEMSLYGVTEYWAYPMETIHHGQGDCEDTSFLLAALYTAAGYDAGVLTIPNHMVAVVSLDGFTRTAVYGVVLAERHLEATGEALYFCETTTDNYVPVGYVTASVYADIMAADAVSMVG